MPRNMSVTLTEPQVRAKTKTVTRRRGWAFLKPGDQLWLCRKCQGLKKGEKVERIALVRVVDVRREELWRMAPEDVAKEGFPDLDVEGFVLMFLDNMGGRPEQEVTRIEFEYVNKEESERR